MEKGYTDIFHWSTLRSFTIILVLLITFTFINATIMADVISHLSSRTPYRFNSNENVTDVTNDENECAKKIWMILRHGTRYPNKMEINYINNRLVEIQDMIFNAYINGSDSLDDIDLIRINDWKPAITDTAQELDLAKEGEIELFEIAKRMKARYPKLFPPLFSNGTYLFKLSNTPRIEKSALYFAEGLFEDVDDVYYSEPSEDGSDIPRYYKLCRRWNNEVDHNTGVLHEIASFETSSIVQEAIEAVNRALGLTNKLCLNDVRMIYKTCGYETAWFRRSRSPWCLAFDSNTIKVLDYLEDLESYLYNGYAFEINSKQACPTLKDMLDFFEDDSGNRTATLHFSHRETFLKLISYIGLYHDETPLLHSNYQPNGERQWHQSKISTFATNLAFILLDCNGTKRAILRHNEYVVRLSACPNNDICDLHVVKEYYKESIKNCDFDVICGN